MIASDLKAELKLTPTEREQALRAPHSKVDGAAGRRCFSDAKHLWSAAIHLRTQVTHYSFNGHVHKQR